MWIMAPNRRRFLRTSLGAAVGLGTACRRAAGGEEVRKISLEELDRVAEAPVLQVGEISRAVKIHSMELLRNGRNFLVRVRDQGRRRRARRSPTRCTWCIRYPIFLNRVAPFFVGKDARQLEDLLWELYRHDDNYKYQGLALWVCVAAAEFAILDLLGKLRASRSATCSAG